MHSAWVILLLHIVAQAYSKDSTDTSSNLTNRLVDRAESSTNKVVDKLAFKSVDKFLDRVQKESHLHQAHLEHTMLRKVGQLAMSPHSRVRPAFPLRSFSPGNSVL